MQAIRTTFHGPTDTRPSRVTAKAEAGKLTLEWLDGLGVEANHRRAALAFTRKMGWDKPCYGRLVSGGFKDSDVHVSCPKWVGTVKLTKEQRAQDAALLASLPAR